MPLGIKPTVDFAFKKIFGSPENSLALMGLLNAILDLKHPIVAVDIKNPFSYQEFAESKLIEFEQAIETIETISFKTEDKLMYDQREKAQRDYRMGAVRCPGRRA